MKHKKPIPAKFAGWSTDEDFYIKEATTADEAYDVLHKDGNKRSKAQVRERWEELKADKKKVGKAKGKRDFDQKELEIIKDNTSAVAMQLLKKKGFDRTIGSINNKRLRMGWVKHYKKEKLPAKRSPKVGSKLSGMHIDPEALFPIERGIKPKLAKGPIADLLIARIYKTAAALLIGESTPIPAQEFRHFNPSTHITKKATDELVKDMKKKGVEAYFQHEVEKDHAGKKTGVRIFRLL